MFPSGLDGPSKTPAASSRSRRRRSRRSSPGKRSLPGRFFRPSGKYKRLRLQMLPVHLGECDWLLYRRSFNPYRIKTRKGQAYSRGFAACKAAFPKPTWSPL